MLSSVGLPQGYAMRNIAVLSNDAVLIHYDAPKVTDVKTTLNTRPIGYGNSKFILEVI